MGIQSCLKNLAKNEKDQCQVVFLGSASLKKNYSTLFQKEELISHQKFFSEFHLKQKLEDWDFLLKYQSIFH